MDNRVQQTVSSVMTDYLNDVQPGLTEFLAQTTGNSTERYVHAPRGIHSIQNATGDWSYSLQDGLGSVRNDQLNYDPYGQVIGTAPTAAYFGFTGKQTDANGSVFLRARYYEPQLGMFSALDPFEGLHGRPMSLNGYSWVEGNVPNAVDPSGMRPDCPIGDWDCEAVNDVFNLRQAFLESAARHNQIPNMDDAGFAALIASIIVGERRIGRVPEGDRMQNRIESTIAFFGCVTSGNYLQQAWEDGNYLQLGAYLLNFDVPDDEPIYAYASVGIANIKLPTAANVLNNQACDAFGNCIDVAIKVTFG